MSEQDKNKREQGAQRGRDAQQQGQSSEAGRQQGQKPQKREPARDNARPDLHPKEQGGWGEDIQSR